MLEVARPLNDSGVHIPDEIFDFIIKAMWSLRTEKNSISLGHKIMVSIYKDSEVNQWVATLQPIELSLLHDWIILYAKDEHFSLYGNYLQRKKELNKK